MVLVFANEQRSALIADVVIAGPRPTFADQADPTTRCLLDGHDHWASFLVRASDGTRLQTAVQEKQRTKRASRRSFPVLAPLGRLHHSNDREQALRHSCFGFPLVEFLGTFCLSACRATFLQSSMKSLISMVFLARLTSAVTSWQFDSEKSPPAASGTI